VQKTERGERGWGGCAAKRERGGCAAEKERREGVCAVKATEKKRKGVQK
jgi:hypothetical protein